MYGAGFVQVFVIPTEPVVESNLPVWSSCWKHGSKIDKFTVQFVSWFLWEHFWLGELVGSAQFWSGYLYLYLCIHRNNACFFEFIVCMFASFAVTWDT